MFNNLNSRLYRFERDPELIDRGLHDSVNSYLRNSAVFSDEECARIRSNLLSDDCMQLIEEEFRSFNNLSAWSASWHDNDSLHDAYISKAYVSGFCPLLLFEVTCCNEALQVEHEKNICHL